MTPLETKACFYGLRTPLLATVSVLIMLSAGHAFAQSDVTYVLREVRRYGQLEDDRPHPAEGPVLGSLRGVAQGTDSTVYILDRAFYKIAWFRPSGSFGGVILGGHGAGPGEFRLPVHLAMTESPCWTTSCCGSISMTELEDTSSP